MPEGDSVLQLSQRLQFMVGRDVTATSIRVPRHVLATFNGMTCQRVWPYGKHLFMQFDGQILHTHLKMEGMWDVHFAGERWRKPAHTARVILQLSDATRDIELVGYSLGFVDVYPTGFYMDKVGYLGPDILDPQWAEDGGRQEALSRILSRPERRIGLALLDQRNVAGIGNEYRAEACFIAGIHPAARVEEVDVARVLDVARRIMWANRYAPIRVTTGVRRVGETTYVFGRGGAKCRRCGTRIEKSVLGGVDAGGEEGELERIIWWCPKCQ